MPQNWNVIEGDCVEEMAKMEADSVDAVVCDPPYGLEFMGKEWDRLNVEKRGNAALMPTGESNYRHDGRENVGGRLSRTAAPPTPKKNPRCRKCERLKTDKEPYRCKCEHPDWDTRTREFGWAMQEWHEAWAREALRVLKPGGHLLAFGGTRTSHRLTCAIEDAGFEIRDTIAWMYGSGFPKSLDVSKAIDKANGKHERDLVPFGQYIRQAREGKGWSLRQLDEAMGTNTAASWWEGRKSGVQPPGIAMYERLKTVLGLDDRYDKLVEWVEAEREKIGERQDVATRIYDNGDGPRLPDRIDVTAPATPEAQQWDGWGTALKPSHEPVVVARKPLTGTVAGNVLEHGTGALNIDGTRIGRTEGDRTDHGLDGRTPYNGTAGRWPANVVLSHTPECQPTGTRKIQGWRQGTPNPDNRTAWDCHPECPVQQLDQQSGLSTSVANKGALDDMRGGQYAAGNGKRIEGSDPNRGFSDTGGASRFFYVAKASSAERNAGLDGFAEQQRQVMDGGAFVKDKYPDYDARGMKTRNTHPTVKPIELMRWLVRLVTPPNGLVLDPFAGSGTTGIAAVLEGFQFVGIEQSPEYAEIARARIQWWARHPDGMALVRRLELEQAREHIKAGGQLGMF